MRLSIDTNTLVVHQGNFEEFVVRASALKNMRTKVLTTNTTIADPSFLAVVDY